MNKTITTMTLSVVIATSSIALHTQAAVLARAQGNVNATKSDTNSLMMKMSAVQADVHEIVSTTNAQIAETIDVRETLEPIAEIQLLKQQLKAAGLDPQVFLEMQGLENAIQMFITQQSNLQEIASDPNITLFREEFLEFLINLENARVDKSLAEPMQESHIYQLIDNAPDLVVGLIKHAFGTRWPTMKTNVAELAASVVWLSDQGFFEEYANLDDFLSSQQDITNVSREQNYFKATKTLMHNKRLILDLERTAMKIPSTPINVAIWGWAGSHLDAGDDAAEAIEIQIFSLKETNVLLEHRIAQIQHFQQQ